LKEEEGMDEELAEAVRDWATDCEAVDVADTLTEDEEEACPVSEGDTDADGRSVAFAVKGELGELVNEGRRDVEGQLESEGEPVEDGDLLAELLQEGDAEA
jgi:hypothetical protein